MAENNNSATQSKPCICVGYAYVPDQEWGKTYDVEKSLCQGTVFPELDLGIGEYGYKCGKKGGECK